MESADSICSLYRYFLSSITQKSLNAFYYACSYAKMDYSRFMNSTTRLSLCLLSQSLISQPVFFSIDDTIVSKFDSHFEDVSKLFDHTAHNVSNSLNGHCSVSLMLCVLVWTYKKYYTLLLLLDTGCGRNHNPNWSWQFPCSLRSCPDFKKKILLFFVTVGM